MWLKWLPWRYVISRVARARGFVDPIAVLSRLHRFAQPSEVTEPIELLRAGIIFQARGLINTRAIQHNLDWVWPYWIERQFDPRDASFVPRAFSVTHVNLTHRNWTAVGVPGSRRMPLIDPRGLVTPLFDGWSLDAWVVPDQGMPLLPSRAEHCEQRLLLEDPLAVETLCRRGNRTRLTQTVDVVMEGDQPICRLRIATSDGTAGWLVSSLRPANPEGVSFVHEIERSDARRLRVNREADVLFSQSPDRLLLSDYRHGDVYQHLHDGPERDSIVCDVGMATAAAMFRIPADRASEFEIRVPLSDLGRFAFEPDEPHPPASEVTAWSTLLRGTCRLDVPDERIRFLFDAAVRNLVLFSPDDCYPGPYTSKRFWFRDAAFIVNALLTMGLANRARRVLDRYPLRQRRDGFFRSQEGEWDANGQALWILDRYQRLTGEPLSTAMLRAVARGARWIWKKRLAASLDAPHAGLLPAGFSAEHLGPNDHYYWDDFWSVAGLRCAARLLRDTDSETADRAEQEAHDLLGCIDRSLERTAHLRRRESVPAAPTRRLDAGAIGSLACSYPTQVWEPQDARLLATVEFILENCTVHNGFFQDMIHSGINAYLTLHVAEALLRAGDSRHWDLVTGLRDLASPTGQWPEAIHPHTRGGCMGDGQHIWAASEWVLMLRNCFVREEGERLILGSGLPEAWLSGDRPMTLGPTPTPYGAITVTVTPADDEVVVSWEAAWRGEPPALEVRLAGFRPTAPAAGDGQVRLARRAERPASAESQR